MYKIIKKRQLNETVTLMKFEAPMAAARAKSGQFVIIRVDEYGERIPLTIADSDSESITLIFQGVGRTTKMLACLNEGDSIADIAGPLGKPTEFEGIRKACVIGGGVGCAIAYPTAKTAHSLGIDTTVIAGFRSKDLVILESEFEQASDKFILMTDDGSYGKKGFVTTAAEEWCQSPDNAGGTVFAIGPIPMMRAVSEVTRKYGMRTIVSLNPVMIDGTGMCGCCRVTVGGKTFFACADGPEFDGHLVDFDSLVERNRTYSDDEKRCGDCRLMKM